MYLNRLHVLKEPTPFALEQGEHVLYTSTSSRQELKLKEKQFSVTARDGTLHVTNKRLVFVTGSLGDVESFQMIFSAAERLHFTHSAQSPWFGPNYWLFMFLATGAPLCDGFPVGKWIEGSIVFKDGGMFDCVGAINKALTDSVHNKHIDDELPRYSA